MLGVIRKCLAVGSIKSRKTFAYVFHESSRRHFAESENDVTGFICLVSRKLARCALVECDYEMENDSHV